MRHLEDFDKYPSVMGAELEIEVMHALMEMPFSYLEKEVDKLGELVGRLSMSHIDGGIYDIRRSNEKEFFRFADWLDSLYDRLGEPRRLDADDFRISFDDMVEEYPSMAEWDDNPPDRK